MGSLEIAAAVFIGAIVFWFLVVMLLQQILTAIRESTYKTITRFSAVAIMVFGAVVLLQVAAVPTADV
jgi:hypothetical protein